MLTGRSTPRYVTVLPDGTSISDRAPAISCAAELARTEPYLAVLDGHPTKFPPDQRFSYCNGGYVILALIAERVSGSSFHELVRERLCAPAGMRNSEFLPSDELPERTAVGYLPINGVSRANVFHLPVRGTGDGGIYSTVADISVFWRSLFAGKIVSAAWLAEMVRPRSDGPSESMRYGLGFWLHRSPERHAGGFRRRCFVSHRARPAVKRHAHRDLQQFRRCLANHPAPRRATGHLNLTSHARR